MEATTFRIALDWIPNTNHVGFYVGLAKGWYQEAGLDVVLLAPSEEFNAEDTPGHRVLSGHADLGLAPSETVISFIHEAHNHPVAIAALLQKDASAIVTLQTSGIDQLRKLDGKQYSCFGGKYEMQIVKELVKGDGGEGSIVEDVAPRLSSFVQVLDGNADAAWVFVPWEGVHAQMNEIPLNVFCVGESSSVKYGYSPVLFASQEIIQDSVKAAKLAALLAVTARGYQYAAEHPEESIDMMVSNAKNAALDQLPREYLLCSLKHLIDQKYFFNDDNQWGHMKPQRWHDFVNVLVEKSVLHGRDGQPCTSEEVDANRFFTNIFLSP